MKKYKLVEYILYTLIVILSILNISSVKRINIYKVLNNKLKTKIIENETIYVNTLNKLESNMAMQYLSEDLPINKDINVKTINGDSLLLQDVFGKTPKIVFHFSELDCKLCVDEEQETLKKVGQLIGNNNIIILASYNRLRDLLLFIKANRIENPVYSLNHKKIGLNIESQNTPFIFISDGDMIAKSIFSIVRANPRFSKMYYQQILYKYFNIDSDKAGEL